MLRHADTSEGPFKEVLIVIEVGLMDLTCLLVDLSGLGLAEAWQEQVSGTDYGLALSCASSLDEAQVMLKSGSVLVQVLFANDNSADLQTLLKSFQANVGCIADFQAIVCEDPSPVFMAGVFEFGIEQFILLSAWPSELAVVTRRAAELMHDTTSAEYKTLSLSRSIRSADQGAIKQATDALGDLAEYDYRIAFTKGKAQEATGDYVGAADAYASARSMNKMFRPSATKLGENLLVTGRFNEALEVFKTLEKTNPYDAERKASLATVYIEKGDMEMAQRYLDAAAKLAPKNTKLLEAQAQLLLSTGKIAEAFVLLDQLSDVGPYFASKLNELGIKLSQAGKGKSALALYQKAHKIVRPELRYKITLNATLACRRLKAWDMAMKYALRCEKEFGGRFEKLDKIKESIITLQKQEAAAPPQGAVAATPPIDKAG